MSTFYDALETRSAQERDAQQFTQLSDTFIQVLHQSPYYAELLADFAGLKAIDAGMLAGESYCSASLFGGSANIGASSASMRKFLSANDVAIFPASDWGIFIRSSSK